MPYHMITLGHVLCAMKAGQSFSAFRKIFHSFLLGLVVAVLAFASPLPAAAQRGVAVGYLADESASLTIEAVASPEKAEAFKGYVPSFMAFSRLPDTFNGAIWLRFSFDAAFEIPVSALRIDLGTSLPGVTRLFIPRKDGSFASMESLPQQGFFTLPEDAPFPDVVYARIDGTPGLWFRPSLGPVDKSPHTYPLHFIMAGLFAFAMLLLLFQYIRKAEEWRLWAAITAGCGIVAAILPSTPIAGAAYSPLMAAAMLIPGLLLLFFVHTTRHLFNSPATMPGYDTVLLLLYLLGAAIALLPLAPGFLWVNRFLPFVGVALLPLLPICMVALARSLRGCALYFCASLLPVLGVAASAWELTATGSVMLAGTGGLWGFCLAMLVLSVISPAKAVAEDSAEDDIFDSLNRSPALTLHEERQPQNETREPEHQETPLSGALDMPAPQDAPKERVLLEDAFPSLSLFGSDAQTTEPQAPQAQPKVAAQEQETPVRRETLPPLDATIPLDVFTPQEEAAFREKRALQKETPPQDDAGEDAFPSLSLFGNNTRETEQQAPPEQQEPVAPQMPEATLPIPDEAISPRAGLSFIDTEEPAVGMPTASPASGNLPAPQPVSIPQEQPQQPALVRLADEIVPESSAPVQEQKDPQQLPGMERRKNRRILFNLPLLIKNMYDALSPLAEGKNCSMTWYIAPQTGRLFEGEATLLESALQRILHDMVESVEQGNVRLSIRRLPDSAEAGHLVFTIAGWDAKQTAAHERDIEGHAEAWALAEKTGGIFSVEHSPSGTTVIFSALFTLLDNARATEVKKDAEPAPIKAPVVEASTPSVQLPSAPVTVFSDYPDIAAPEIGDIHIVSTPLPPRSTGIDTTALTDDQETERAPNRLIVADIAASGRARTTAIFADTPYAVLECTSPVDAYTLYRSHPSAAVILNADMPEVDIIAALKDIHANDAEYGRTPAVGVAIVGYEAQAERLAHAGFSHSVLKVRLGEDLLPLVEKTIPLPSTDLAETATQAEAPTPEIRMEAALADLPPVKTATPAPDKSLPAPQETAPVADIAPELRENGIFASILPPSEPEKDLPTPEAAPVAAKAQKPSDPGLGLLDMIITDEEEPTSVQSASHKPVPDQTPPVLPRTLAQKQPQIQPLIRPQILPKAQPSRPQARPQSQPQGQAQNRPDAEPAGHTAQTAPKNKATVKVRPPQHKPQSTPPAEAPKMAATTAPAEAPAPAHNTVTIRPRVTVQHRPVAQPNAAPVQPVSTAPIPTVQAAAPVQPVARIQPNVPAQPVVPEQVATTAQPVVQEQATPATQPVVTTQPVEPQASPVVASPAPAVTDSTCIPLPGEEDSVFKDMVPLIPGLIVDLSDALTNAVKGREAKDPQTVENAARNVGDNAGRFGLARLEHLSRCVERAAAEKDLEAIEYVLADLEAWIARYKDALQKVHREMVW